MNPGATTRPETSIVRPTRSGSTPGARSRTRSPSIATFPGLAGTPVPSTIEPPARTRAASCMTAIMRWADGLRRASGSRRRQGAVRRSQAQGVASRHETSNLRSAVCTPSRRDARRDDGTRPQDPRRAALPPCFPLQLECPGTRPAHRAPSAGGSGWRLLRVQTTEAGSAQTRHAARVAGVTDVRAGVYAFMDLKQVSLGGSGTLDDCALTISRRSSATPGQIATSSTPASRRSPANTTSGERMGASWIVRTSSSRAPRRSTAS